MYHRHTAVSKCITKISTISFRFSSIGKSMVGTVFSFDLHSELLTFYWSDNLSVPSPKTYRILTSSFPLGMWKTVTTTMEFLLKNCGFRTTQKIRGKYTTTSPGPEI